MWKEVTGSETNRPFNCSDELIEQGVDNFRPILEKAGVFSSENNSRYPISRRRLVGMNYAVNSYISSIKVEDIYGENQVFLIKPGARINLEAAIEILVARANGDRARPAVRVKHAARARPAAKSRSAANKKLPKRDRAIHKIDN